MTDTNEHREAARATLTSDHARELFDIIEPPQPAEVGLDPLCYEKRRCAELASDLRQKSMDTQDTDHASGFKKLLWDAAYWLDRMANRPAAEVGLDLQMLRHNVIDAANEFVFEPNRVFDSGPSKEGSLADAVFALHAAEEEHLKIVAANPPVGMTTKNTPATDRSFDTCQDCGGIRALHDGCRTFVEPAALPLAAEVGLDLHMLRHNVIEAAKAFARRVPPQSGPEEGREACIYRAAEIGLLDSTLKLIAAEEEHRKIVAANPPVENTSLDVVQLGVPEHSPKPASEEALPDLAEGKATVCRELRTLANDLLNGGTQIDVPAGDGLNHRTLEGDELEGTAEMLAKAAWLIDGMTFDDALRCLCKWEERNPFNPECPVHTAIEGANA